MSMGGLTDSPMEAIAIMNYLRVQHGAWAWLAAFLTTTAAAIISISRLGNRLSPIINIINISHSRSSSHLAQQPDEMKDEKEIPCSSTSCNTSSSSSSSSIFTTTLSCTLEKTASGKFTLYYVHDDNISNISSSSSHDDFIDLDDDNDDNHIKSQAAAAGKRRLEMMDGRSCSNQVQQWDLATLKMKAMDLGWYNNQDLARLDGNVVRLWNQINPL